MQNNIEHIKSLTENARNALDLPLRERINKCKEKAWIPYPKAVQIMDELEELFDHPKTDRMPNLLITGETNNGKTSILNRFYAAHPNYSTPLGNVIPVVHFSAPISPSQNALYEKILDFLKVPYGVNDSSSRKEFQVLSILQDIKTSVIVIDEFQDIYHGTTREQSKFLAALRHLGTDLRIPIIAAGIPVVQRTLTADPQMANRFETMRLDNWKLDKEYARLVMSFERTLPLKEPSSLQSKEMVVKLHDLSEGILGEVATILKKASIHAMKNGKEHIEIGMLDAIPYHRPSERRKA